MISICCHFILACENWKRNQTMYQTPSLRASCSPHCKAVTPNKACHTANVKRPGCPSLKAQDGLNQDGYGSFSVTDAVDGNWGCWSSWSACNAAYRRSRSRECNNPEPQRGGQRCEGKHWQEEDCTFSIMEKV